MAAKIYTIASGKGGAGKTTVSVNLATTIAGFGKKTLLIDADIGMANLGLMLGLDNTPITLHDVLAGSANAKEAIYDGPNGLKILPGGLTLKGYYDCDLDQLENVIKDINDQFDFIIIDTPSGINKDVMVSLKLADEVILVVNPEAMSVADTMKTRSLTRMYNKNVKGVILNRMDPSSQEDIAKKIENSLDSKIISTIYEDTIISKSVSLRSPIVIKYPQSPSAIAFKRAAALMTDIEVPEEDLQVSHTKNDQGFLGRIRSLLFG
ncbi:MAG: cell division ATPase MinD [Methanosarcinaceae archaeon]|nr:cell division ATPase MinD [Methanosarcinaceae archaeon]